MSKELGKRRKFGRMETGGKSCKKREGIEKRRKNGREELSKKEKGQKRKGNRCRRRK